MIPIPILENRHSSEDVGTVPPTEQPATESDNGKHSELPQNESLNEELHMDLDSGEEGSSSGTESGI
ncbi:hypothetical protein BGZ92_004617, partial [Podila epicladia]